MKGNRFLQGLLKFLVLLILLFFFWIKISENVPNYVYGFDHYGYFAHAQGLARYGFGGGWGQDSGAPELAEYLINRELISISPEFDLGSLLTPPSFWLENFEDGTLINQYPPGFPLLLSFFKGHEAGIYYLNAALVSFWCGLLFLFCHKKYYWHYLIGVTAVLFLPEFFNNTLLVTADIISTILVLTAYFLLGPESAERKRVWYIFGAGCACGFSFLVRYPNIIVMPLFLVLIISQERVSGTKKRVFLAAVFFLGGVFSSGLLPIGIYLWRLFGTLWQSTYLYHEPLSVKYLLTGLIHYLGFPFKYGVSALGIVGCALYGLSVSAKGNIRLRHTVLAGLLLCVTYILFYSCYTTENFDPRYILPAIGLVMIGFAHGLIIFLDRYVSSHWGVKALASLIFIVLLISGSEKHYISGDRIDHHIFRKIEDFTPDNAIILASGWSGTVRHYCHRKSYRWLWTSKEVVDSTVEFFLEKKYPLFVLFDHKGDTAQDYKLFLTKRFVLKQTFLHFSERKIELYRILGYAADGGLSHGKIIPEMGSEIVFEEGIATFQGPGVAYNLSVFQSRQGSFPGRNDSSFLLAGTWQGLFFHLFPEYRLSQQTIVIQVEYRDDAGDFVIAHIVPDGSAQQQVIVLEGSGQWLTGAVAVQLSADDSGEIRIQNDDDQDQILIRRVKILPALAQPQAFTFAGLEQKLLETSKKKDKPLDRQKESPPTSSWDYHQTLLLSPLPRVRAQTLLELLQTAPASIIPNIMSQAEKLLTDPYFLVRYYTLCLLKQSGVSESTAELVKLCLQDEMALNRRTAAIILLQKNDRTGIAVLKQDLNSPNYWEKLAAEKILQNFNIPYHRKYKPEFD
ncbi:glycosyltransferase family 39 protein [candidate division CSSED10-310 bacterium]|uniref:Glycosyltransferase family 39 protein n=1 Tax=candidate division CSSED10-310 bacterium TaxID=2855610 RepID=A0ABV6YSH8_UNCC1